MALAATAATDAGVEAQSAGPAFLDVDYSQWYAAGVSFCNENGIMTGYGDGTYFGPLDGLTTEQVATILFRIACKNGTARASDYATTNTTGLSDVKNDWYTQACNWAKAAGVINGYGGTDRMGVGDAVPFERFVTILANYLSGGANATADGSRVTTLFTDGSQISSWARGSAVWAVDAGLMRGNDLHDGTYSFGAAEDVYRARAATILMRGCRAGVIRLSADASQDGGHDADATTYAISFDGNGATSGSMATLTADASSSVTLTRNAYARTGYRFLGWSTSASATSAVYADGASVSGLAKAGSMVTLHAVWQPITYKIAVDANGGTGGTTLSATYDSDVTLSAKLARSGYTLRGLNTKADGAGVSYGLGSTAKNLTSTQGSTVTLYAQWQKDAAPKVTFSGAEASAAVSEDGYVTLPSATRVGYTFKAWRSLGGNTYAAGTRMEVTSDMTFTAEWTPITYSYNIDPNGGTGGAGGGAMYDRDVTLNATTLTRPGYKLVGLNTKADGSGTSYVPNSTVRNLTSTAGDKVTIYAIWQPITYKVAIDANGGTGGSTITATYDRDVTLSATLARSGYSLKSLNTEADGTGTAYAVGSAVRNLSLADGSTVTLYAVWEKDKPASYSVSFKSGSWGTGSMDSQTVVAGSSFSIPDSSFTSWSSSYTFDGWKDAAGNTYKAGESVTPTSDLVLTARWRELTKEERVVQAQARVDAAQAALKTAIQNAGGDYDQYAKGSFGFFEERGSQGAIDILNHTYSNQTDDEGRSFVSFTHEGDVSDATSLANMRKGIWCMQRLNEKRHEYNAEYATQIANGDVAMRTVNGIDVSRFCIYRELQDVTITDTAMAVAQTNANWSALNGDHAGNHGGYGGFENAAWGYSDPYDGWYDEEKVNYDTENGKQVGHYLNCVDGAGTANGMWVVPVTSSGQTEASDWTYYAHDGYGGAAYMGGAYVLSRYPDYTYPYGDYARTRKDVNIVTNVPVGTRYSVSDYSDAFEAYYKKVTGGADVSFLEKEANSAEIALKRLQNG